MQPSVHMTDELTTHSQHTLKHKKACVVLGCSELIAPTMWRHHLGLHAQGLFPGAVPQSWLAEQDLFICPYCLLLVANSHHSSHQRKCSHSFNVPASCFDEAIDPPLSLPSLTDVFQAKCNTIRHIPSRDKQAFAQVLSSTLMAVVHENSELAWLKLLMLPKSVPSGEDVITSPYQSVSYVTYGLKGNSTLYGNGCYLSLPLNLSIICVQRTPTMSLMLFL